MENAVQSPDLLRLLDLVKSNDVRVSSDAFCALRDSINTGDGFVLELCFNDYVQFQCEKMLDTITSVREPNDKVLWDCISSVMKTHPYVVLDVFFSVIRKSPIWMQKLPNTPVFSQFLKSLKQNADIPYAIGGLYILSSLLPLLPSLTAHFNCLCQILLASAKLQQKHAKTFCEPNLRSAVVSFFQSLYGLYPSNLLGFLRTQFFAPSVSPAHTALFNEVVRPMLKTVTLHPVLISSNKDLEMMKDRWVNKEPHDIFVECVDVTVEGLGSAPLQPVPPEATVVPTVFYNSTTSELSSYKTSPAKQESFDFSFTRLRRPPSKEEPSITPINEEPIALEVAATENTKESLDWFSPSEEIGLSTPPGSRPSTPCPLDSLDERFPSSPSGNRTDETRVSLRASRQKRSADLKFRRSFGSAISKFLGLPDSPTSGGSLRQRRSTGGTRSVPPSPSTKLLQRELEAGRHIGRSAEFVCSTPSYQQAEIAEEASEITGIADGFDKSQNGANRKSTVAINLMSRLNFQKDATTGANGSFDQTSRVRHSSSQSSCGQMYSRRPSSIDVQGKYVGAGCLPSGWFTSDEWIFGSDDKGIARCLPHSQEMAQQLHRKRAITSNRPIRGGDVFMSRAYDYAVDVFQNKLRRSVRARSLSCPAIHLSFSKDRQTFVRSSGTRSAEQWFVQKSDNQGRLSQTASLSYGSDCFQPNFWDDEGRTRPFPTNYDSDWQTSDKLRDQLHPAAEKYMQLSKQFFEDLAELYDTRSERLSGEEASSIADIPEADREHFLTLKIAMLEYQLEYEQYRRQMHAERNRRMHGRIKHVVSLETQLQSDATRIKWLNYERQQIVDTVDRLNRENMQIRENMLQRDRAWMQRKQALEQEKQSLKEELEQCNNCLTLQKEDSQRVREDMSKVTARLLDKEHQVNVLTNELTLQKERVTELSQLISTLRMRLRVADKLEKEMKNCRYRLLLASKGQEVAETMKKRYEKENEQLRDSMRKCQVRTEAAIQSAAQTEAKLCKKRAQIDELQNALSTMRSLHQEQVEAVEMKYKALMTVCTRQEVHIMELYQQIEETNNNIRCRMRSQEIIIPKREEAKEVVSLEDSFVGESDQSYGDWNQSP
ncbi:Hamartin domain containing protein [Trichuris trichiura]|uniref:Hamartin domain containing protein n=1 Tax=Trichuris trichiura TaxID=36087 RepID=A0A077Z0B2_TRITR|nr:Hamartin domain containing protein [Trichuris trichiura]